MRQICRLLTHRYASSTSFPITKIDQKGVVTVTDLKSKQTFQFQVMDPTLLRTLKVGQLVYPDFQNQKVSLDGVNPCCPMVNSLQLRPSLERRQMPNKLEPSGPSPDVKSLNPIQPPMQVPVPPTRPQR
jgi:hypothetical protein